MPIMAVAVNRTGSGAPAISLSPTIFSNQNPGKIPIIVRGIADMIISDKVVDAVWKRSTTNIAMSAKAKARPMSRKTSSVIFHSPSPVQEIEISSCICQGSLPPLSIKLRMRQSLPSRLCDPRSALTSAMTSAGVRPDTSAVTYTTGRKSFR